MVWLPLPQSLTKAKPLTYGAYALLEEINNRSLAGKDPVKIIAIALDQNLHLNHFARDLRELNEQHFIAAIADPAYSFAFKLYLSFDIYYEIVDFATAAEKYAREHPTMDSPVLIVRNFEAAMKAACRGGDRLLANMYVRITPPGKDYCSRRSPPGLKTGL